MVELFTTMPYKMLEARIKTKDYCFVLERLRYGNSKVTHFLQSLCENIQIPKFQSGHYAISDYIDEESLKYLRLMRYDIYWGYCVAMFYKTWPFKTVFDLHVLHVIESGIQQYWELGVCYSYNFQLIAIFIN